MHPDKGGCRLLASPELRPESFVLDSASGAASGLLSQSALFQEGR